MKLELIKEERTGRHTWYYTMVDNTICAYADTDEEAAISHFNHVKEIGKEGLLAEQAIKKTTIMSLNNSKEVPIIQTNIVGDTSSICVTK